jgi:hypothetical protein
MIKMGESIADPAEDMIIRAEICYLCNINRKGKEFVRDAKKPLANYLKELMQNFKNHEFNIRILQTLIETGYC